MYRLHKYIDEIKFVEDRKAKEIQADVYGVWGQSYLWFSTYEEARQCCIDRAKGNIAGLESELRLAKRRLKKVEKLPINVPNPEPSVARDDTQ